MNAEKHLRHLTLIGFMLLTTIAVAAQTEWQFVALTSSGGVVGIDKNFIPTTNGMVRVWQKILLPDDRYTITLCEWECAKKRYRNIQAALYGADGRLIERDDERTPWRYFVPDSTGMLLYLNICGEGDRKGSSGAAGAGGKPVSSFAQIITKRADLMSEANARSEVIRRVALNEKLTLLSTEPAGVWYQVIDPKTNSQGWLHGNDFKIVKAKKPLDSVRRRTRRK